MFEEEPMGRTSLAAIGIIALALPAQAARGPYPVAVAAAADGTIYVADAGQGAILRLEDGDLVPHAKGKGLPRTPLANVRAIAVDGNGEILAGDPSTFELYRISKSGEMKPLTGGELLQPYGVAIDAKGQVFVADLEADAVFRIGADGKLSKVADVDAPTGLAIDGDGSLVAVTRGSDSLVRISLDGKVTPIVKGRKLAFPHHVVVDPQGGYIVSDGYAKAIVRVTAAGETKPIVQGAPLVNPVGLARAPDGMLYVADPKAGKLFRIGADGKVEVAADLSKEKPAAKS